MKGLHAWWDRSKPTLRLPATLALAMLAATAFFYMSMLAPAEERLRGLEDTIAKRRPAPELLTVSYQTGPTEPAAKLRAFYAFFDKGTPSTEWLARLYAAAERAGVELKLADYRRVEPADVPLLLQEVTLPVTGDYARVRAFAEGVLGTVPVASLDHVSLRRPRVNVNQIEAELKFTIHLPRPRP
ncbi:MAG TPA: hypothetical protein VLD59_01125 [Steroidobacteraceae bacterium]|nr:hypothetical protein [Steroidobacteraceae bacterium]